MKAFALQLKGCTKKDRKKVIKLAKSVGFKWVYNDKFKFRRWDYVAVYRHNYSKRLLYGVGIPTDNKPLYQMPRDWNKIQEALCVNIEPKDGGIYTQTKPMLSIFRSNGVFDYSYSNVYPDGKFYRIGNIGLESFRKATPEEEAKLIEAEHKHGYYWNGLELAKIPEYVEDMFSKICKVTSFDSWGIKYNGGGTKWSSIRPSTREAYEAQNKPIYEVGQWYSGDHSFILPIRKFEDEDDLFICVGFIKTGGVWCWVDGLSWDLEGLHPADMAKVEELLIKEASSRYPKGTIFNNADKSSRKFRGKNTDTSLGCFYVNDAGVFTGNHQYVLIFEAGKWATIIELSELEKLKAENERLKAKLNKIRTECDY